MTGNDKGYYKNMLFYCHFIRFISINNYIEQEGINKTIDTNSPKQITVPKGPQSGERLMIIGITPTDAAAEVEIGRITSFSCS